MPESAGMIAQPYHIYIERIEPENNMARYYAMEISASLFGEACLIRTWGRIGKRGQSKIHHFQSERDAVVLFLELMRQKRKRGYRPRPVRLQSFLPSAERRHSLRGTSQLS